MRRNPERVNMERFYLFFGVCYLGIYCLFAERTLAFCELDLSQESTYIHVYITYLHIYIHVSIFLAETCEEAARAVSVSM